MDGRSCRYWQATMYFGFMIRDEEGDSVMRGILEYLSTHLSVLEVENNGNTRREETSFHSPLSF